MRMKNIIKILGAGAILLSASSAFAQVPNGSVPCANGDIRCKVGPAPSYVPNFGVTSPKNANVAPPKNTLKPGDYYTGEPGKRVYHSPAGQAIARGATGSKYGSVAKENRTYSYMYNEPDPEIIGEFTENPVKNHPPRYTKP